MLCRFGENGRRGLWWRGLLVLVAAWLMACGDVSTGLETERIVAGVDLNQLFAPPTASERQQVLDDWAMRDVAVHDVQLVAQARVVLDDVPATLHLLRHTVVGQQHVGAVIIPDTLQMLAPVLVWLHGGDEGVRLETDVWPLADSLNLSRFVLVVPAFRGEALVYRGFTFPAEGVRNPWDGDVDDALALLYAVWTRFSIVDTGRVVVLGIDRGATSALIMAIREERIRVAIGVAGLTDFFEDFMQQVVEEALQGTIRPIPGLSAFVEQVLVPLKEGQLSMAAARLALLRRSPVYFSERLPAGQWHHGRNDPVVAVAQAMRLDAGRPDRFQVYLYDGEGRDLMSMPGSLERIRGLLQEVIL
ncbi:MAG: peptidase [Rhodothermus sp.]|nr:peptidase [Rhodothermus sp.]